MFEAVERFLANVAGPAGTLLLLDDLQWAGSDALDLLATLARSTIASVRLVGAFRDSEVAPRDALSIMLADLAHAGLATQRTLAPLSAAEAGELLAAVLELTDDRDGLRERVARRTGGVPFFVISCAQVLRLGEQAPTAEAVPWDVAQGIRQRLSALPEDARQVLSMAAIVGRRIPYALLIQVTARAEDEVLTALETARQARLLTDEDHATYQFAHDLIREVIEADLGAARRAMCVARRARGLSLRAWWGRRQSGTLSGESGRSRLGATSQRRRREVLSRADGAPGKPGTPKRQRTSAGEVGRCPRYRGPLR